MLARSPLRRYGKAAARRKYKNQHTEYNGAVYHSAMEARYAALLDLMVKAGKVASWRGQVPIPLEVNGKLICKLVVDFEVEMPDGTKQLRETKGLETDVWRIKHALFKAIYPERSLEIIRSVR